MPVRRDHAVAGTGPAPPVSRGGGQAVGGPRRQCCGGLPWCSGFSPVWAEVMSVCLFSFFGSTVVARLRVFKLLYLVLGLKI